MAYSNALIKSAAPTPFDSTAFSCFLFVKSEKLFPTQTLGFISTPKRDERAYPIPLCHLFDIRLSSPVIYEFRFWNQNFCRNCVAKLFDLLLSLNVCFVRCADSALSDP